MMRRTTQDMTNQFHVSRMGAMAMENWSVPPEEENVESALVIPNEDGRFRVEVLLSLHDEFDIK